jgi:Domain of unknown function (DUF1992)
MTERKPPEISFTSWIDRQINEAAQRGAFENLPGAGQPLPKRDDDGQAWLRDYLRREGVSAEELLPVPLKLRKEVERLTGTVQELHSEQEVRKVVADINRRIMEWRRIPVGPPVFLRLVNEDMMVGKWRDARATPRPAPSPAPAGPGTADPESAPPRRWRWRRRRNGAGRRGDGIDR